MLDIIEIGLKWVLEPLQLEKQPSMLLRNFRKSSSVLWREGPRQLSKQPILQTPHWNRSPTLDQNRQQLLQPARQLLWPVCLKMLESRLAI